MQPRAYLPSPALLSLLVAAPLWVLVGCANPNYCEGHEDNDCRKGEVVEESCATAADCTNPGKSVCALSASTQQLACKACAAHTECTSSQVCLSNGACADEATVAYVSQQGTNNATCSRAQPCDQIAKALATSRPYIKVSGQLDEAVTIERAVALFGEEGSKLTRAGGSPVVEVKGNKPVSIQGLEIGGSGGTGVHAHAGSTLTLIKVSVTDNGGIGVLVDGATLSLSRSIVSLNDGGGIQIKGSSFQIINNFIFRNGTSDGGGDFGGVHLDSSTPGSNRFELNTVVDNHVKSGNNRTGGVLCDIVNFTAANNIIARNDIARSLTSPNANTSGSCSYGSSSIATTVEPFKFLSPDIEPYDYHLTAESDGAIDMGAPLSSLAEGHEDFDKDRRATDSPDLGADEYAPPREDQ